MLLNEQNLTTSFTHHGSLAQKMPVILLLAVIVCVSVISGILAAFGNVVVLVALLALYGMFFILVTPVKWIVWIIFWMVFVITGLAAYFLGFSQLQWLSVLINAALFLPVLFHLLQYRNNIALTEITSDLFLPLIFVFFLICSTLLDKPQLSDFVYSSRHYLLMWPLMLVFMFGVVQYEVIERLWKMLLIVAVMQLPMAIYQYLFVSKENKRLSPWDAVVGTFNGRIEGGGDSAAMAIMLLIVILTAIALWRGNYLKNYWMALVVVSGIGTIALAEVKAAVLLLPIVIGLYYRKELLRRPMESLAVMFGAVVLVVGILTAYQQIHYSSVQRSVYSKVQFNSTYDRIMESINPEAESSGGRQIGRVNHLITWWDNNILSGDIQHSLLGYGMGATHSSKVGAGEIASRFYHQVTNTTSVILLWETGILGHTLFVLILLLAARTSESLSQNESIPEIHRIFLRVAAIGLLLLTITLPYKNFHLYSNPIQFLMMMMLGQAAYWSRYVKKLHRDTIN